MFELPIFGASLRFGHDRVEEGSVDRGIYCDLDDAVSGALEADAVTIGHGVRVSLTAAAAVWCDGCRAHVTLVFRWGTSSFEVRWGESPLSLCAYTQH